MYLFRRSACRALSTSTSSILSKPRSITTISPLVLRASRQSNTLLQQRRWASDEADLKAKEEAATPKESAPASPAAPSKDSPTPSSADSDDHSSVASAVSSVASSVSTKASDAAESVSEAAQTAKATVTDAAGTAAQASGFAPRGDDPSALFIANIPYQTMEEDLKELFGQYGAISKVALPTNETGRPRGFAILQFADATAGPKAVEAMDGQLFNGRNLTVQLAKKRAAPRSATRPPTNPPSDTLFLGNLSFEMSDQDLNDLFSEVNNVTDVRVAIDRRTGQPRGFLHAEFVDTASAQQAHKYFRGKEVHGRRIRVDYGKPSRGPAQRANAAPEDEIPTQ